MFALRIPFSIILFAVIERDTEMVRKMEMEIGRKMERGSDRDSLRNGVRTTKNVEKNERYDFVNISTQRCTLRH